MSWPARRSRAELIDLDLQLLLLDLVLKVCRSFGDSLHHWVVRTRLVAFACLRSAIVGDCGDIVWVQESFLTDGVICSFLSLTKGCMQGASARMYNASIAILEALVAEVCCLVHLICHHLGLIPLQLVATSVRQRRLVGRPFVRFGRCLLLDLLDSVEGHSRCGGRLDEHRAVLAPRSRRLGRRLVQDLTVVHRMRLVVLRHVLFNFGERPIDSSATLRPGNIYPAHRVLLVEAVVRALVRVHGQVEVLAGSRADHRVMVQVGITIALVHHDRVDRLRRNSSSLIMMIASATSAPTTYLMTLLHLRF